jgi:hypothetical protein
LRSLRGNTPLRPGYLCWLMRPDRIFSLPYLPQHYGKRAYANQYYEKADAGYPGHDASRQPKILNPGTPSLASNSPRHLPSSCRRSDFELQFTDPAAAI